MERPPVQSHPFWLWLHPPKDSALRRPCSKLTEKCCELKCAHLEADESEKHLCNKNAVLNKIKYVFYIWPSCFIFKQLVYCLLLYWSLTKINQKNENKCFKLKLKRSGDDPQKLSRILVSFSADPHNNILTYFLAHPTDSTETSDLCTLLSQIQNHLLILVIPLCHFSKLDFSANRFSDVIFAILN